MKKNKLTKKQEKRFDDRFPRISKISDRPESYIILWSEDEHKKLKQHIADELQGQREEIVKELEKIKLPDPNPYGKWVRVPRVNMIIDQAIKIILDKRTED